MAECGEEVAAVSAVIEEKESLEETTERETNDTFSNSLSCSMSCLRGSANNTRKRLESRSVSFPEDESRIVTGYLEPPNPWEHAETSTAENVISHYKNSCERHGTKPISSILKQLESIEIGGERTECLSLKGEPLVTASCEALEEIFKRIQMVKLDLESTGLDDEAAVVLFDMIEYYESAIHLSIANNHDIDSRGWQACARMLKKTRSLEQLDCRGICLTEQLMPIICRALRIVTQLQVLKLENCSLTGRTIVTLVAALKLNTSLKELHLAENSLNHLDAMQLGTLLKCNTILQLLDISNNNIEDNGVHFICEALSEQTTAGLHILVMWNNRLTANSSYYFSKALAKNRTLEMLNVGRNCLGDDFFSFCKDALLNNNNLLRLGVQSCHITCRGVKILAEIIADNPVLQRIDLRENYIALDGLTALVESLRINKSIIRMDIDSVPRNKCNVAKDDLATYYALIDDLKVQCRNNEAAERDQEILDRIKSSMRKISLTCNTLHQRGTPSDFSPRHQGGLLLGVVEEGSTSRTTRLRSPAPSPIPSPVTSPSPIRTRFQVSRVCENSNNSPPADLSPSSITSRFTVTTVSDNFTKTSSDSLTFDNSTVNSINKQNSLKNIIPENVEDSTENTFSETPLVKQSSSGGNKSPRKLASWVPPTNLFTENKTVEKLLGLLPSWGRSGANVIKNSSGESSSPRTCDLMNNNRRSEEQNEQEAITTTWPQGAVGHRASVGSLVITVEQPNQQHSISSPQLTGLKKTQNRCRNCRQ